MNSSFILTVLIGIIALNLQAQQSTNMQSVYDAKKRIVAQMNANNTRCTWNYAKYKELKVDGKTGLYTSDGREIIPPQFKEIFGPPYSWLVPVKKMDSHRYSLFNLAGNQLAESAYGLVVPVLNSDCAVNAIDETNPACRDDSYTFSLNYLCSYYLVMDSTARRGIVSGDHEILLPIEFAEVTHAGGSRFITKSYERPTSYDLVDVETQKTLLENADNIEAFFINKSNPIYSNGKIFQDRTPFYAVKKTGKWQLLNADLSVVLPNSYDEIMMKDSFFIARENQLSELYSPNGDLLVKATPQRITDVIFSPKGFVYVTEEVQDNTYQYTLYNSSGAELLSWENGRFLTNRIEIRGFARLVVSEFPKKDVLAFISIDAENGIFLFKDLTYEVVKRE